MPLRSVVRLPGGPDVFAPMPAVMDDPTALGARITTVFHGNHGTPIRQGRITPDHIVTESGEVAGSRPLGTIIDLGGSRHAPA